MRMAAKQDRVPEDTQHVSVYRGSMYEYNDDPVMEDGAYWYHDFQGNRAEDAITEFNAAPQHELLVL